MTGDGCFLGCAMAVLWLFLRAVKYRFFTDQTITRHLWYLYYVPQILAPLFSLFAALHLGRREDDTFLFQVVSAVHSGGAADRRRSDERPASNDFPRSAGRCDAGCGLYPRLGILPCHDVDCRAAADDRDHRLPQVPRV